MMAHAQGTPPESRFAEHETRLKELEREYQTQRQELRAAYQEIEVLTALQDVALALVSTLDPASLLKGIVNAAMELMNAEGSSLLMLHEESNELVFRVVAGEVSQQLVGRRLKVGEGISGWVAQTGEAVLVEDVQNDPRFSRDFDTSTGFQTQSILCVPMKFQDRLLGVLSIVNKVGPGPFAAKDVKWLQALAAMAAVALENLRLYHRLREERDRVLVAQEELRKKMARDLHDGPTQTLSVMVMHLDLIKKLLQEEPQSVTAELDELATRGQRAIRQMRTMLFDLRPLVLETQGLAAALKLFVERHQVDEEPQIHLSTASELGRYDPRVESAIFSIVQEAVNNALKHAEAHNIWLRLTQRQENLVVEIEDDGLGFALDAVLDKYEERDSLGLISMRERAELIDGQFTIVSAVDRGTTVMLRVPVVTASSAEEEYPEWLIEEEKDNPEAAC